MNLLLSAYSFGAGRGSEPGVGWNVAVGMAQRGHNVTVLTTSEFHHLNFDDSIERPFKILEYDFGIKYFASARSYNYWQRRITDVIRALCSEERFDLVHHVTFNQYRGLKDVFAAPLPYVIGPVGGAEVVAKQFLPDMPFKSRVKEILRYFPYDACSLGARIRNNSMKGIVLASTPQTRDRLQKYAGVDNIELMPIISVRDEEIMSDSAIAADKPYLLFDGGVRHDKGLKLLIRTLSVLWQRGERIVVKVAAVAEKYHSVVKNYAKAHGLPESALELMPFMKRDELLKIMSGAVAFISVSFRDSGCMALLEAVAQGVPCLCLDTPGQFWLPDCYAVKQPISSDIEEQLATSIQSIISTGRGNQSWNIQRADWLRKNMSWSVRISMLEDCYLRAIKLNEIN